MNIISIAIQKGGSGKTTTAINLGAALQLLGKKVLLIDLDPQANLTQAMGFEEPQPNLYDLFKSEFDGQAADLSGAMLDTGGMKLLPASLDLAAAELELIGIYGREKILGVMLQSLDSAAFDYVLIDCPPAIGLLTVNALAASQYVIMPLQAEFLPLRGVHSFMRTFQKIQRQLNPHIDLLGLVLTKYDERKTMNRNVLDQLQSMYGNKVFNTQIRTNIELAKAQEWGVDIFRHDKTSRGATDYLQLAHECLQRIEKNPTPPQHQPSSL